MKVLVITATIGQGHNAVARSIANGLSARGVDCEVLDMYRYFSPALQKIVQGGYLASIKSVSAMHVRKIGEKYYDMMEKGYRPLNEHAFARFKNLPFAKSLKKYLDEYQPDLIICTQVYCVHIMDIVKSKGWTDAVLMGVDTDFTVQAHWQGNDYLDYIVTASEGLTGQLLMKQVPKERVLPFGIPISPRFQERVDKREAREMLCLDPEKKTLLIMGGSMGYGSIDKTILQLDALPFDFQVMVVCGSNLRMRAKLKKLKTNKRFDIYGFSYDIPLMMDAADVMITKPGGISLSEGLAKNLPMVLDNAIPGMEDRNADFMVERGLALAVRKTYPIAQAVTDLLDNDERAAKMRENMKEHAHPDSTEKLCAFIIARATEHEQAKELEALPL
ncbi:MAG: MGDG synthase family glycosyltransferase [Oscillospiraceae bacterium]|jgi:processive 1,2-diacylglycerol beta-glucosyltransferase